MIIFVENFHGKGHMVVNRLWEKCDAIRRRRESRCEDTHASLFSCTLSGKLFRICKLVNVCLCMCVCPCVWMFACFPACQCLSVQCTRYRRICITMNLNNHVWQCVLTLIYFLYKWVKAGVRAGESTSWFHACGDWVGSSEVTYSAGSEHPPASRIHFSTSRKLQKEMEQKNKFTSFLGTLFRHYNEIPLKW